MRKITFYFLCIELLDILTTLVGLHIGLWETNMLLPHLGWANLMIFKICMVIIVAIILEKKKAYWFDVGVIVVSLPYLIWNAIVLIVR